MTLHEDIAAVPAQSGWSDGWYVVPYEVAWRDCDAMGHVNNAVYFSYFEWGRTKYWLELMGVTRIDEIGFIVVRAECDFQRQLNLGEAIEIRSRIGEMRGSSLDFHTEVRRANGKTAATGKVVVVLFSWENQTKLPISDELRERVRAFQGE